jgi:hypothetical protein
MSIRGTLAASLATVRFVFAENPWSLAVITVVPAATPVTTPGLELVELSTVAVAGFDDVQLESAVTFVFEPSLY